MIFHMATASAEDHEIIINSVNPVIYNDQLAVTMSIDNLFTKKSLSTLQSGLQSLVKIDIELYKYGDNASLLSSRTLEEKFQVYRSLSYNIWDEKYYITEKGGKHTFNTLEEFLTHTTHLSNHPLTHITDLDKTASYSLKVMVEFFPISEEQSGKVEAWLTNPHQTKFTLASDEHTNRFQLSSSKLVSMFLGKKNRPENSSKWYSSPKIEIKN